MKHVVKILAKVVALALTALTCSLTSCGLLGPAPECPEPKYYPFTSADEQWQQFSPEEQWVFENQRHERRTYRISKVQNEVKKPNWVSGSQVDYLDYYQDYWFMVIVRTDTIATAGSFMLKRVPVYQHYDRSRLDAQFSWPTYAGQHNDMGGTYSGYLEFGQDLTMTNFHSLKVKGVNYLHVTSFRASSIAVSRLTGLNWLKEITSELDYDQSGGIIRFVTTNGSVWERMP